VRHKASSALADTECTPVAHAGCIIVNARLTVVRSVWVD